MELTRIHSFIITAMESFDIVDNHAGTTAAAISNADDDRGFTGFGSSQMAVDSPLLRTNLSCSCCRH